MAFLSFLTDWFFHIRILSTKFIAFIWINTCNVQFRHIHCLASECIDYMHGASFMPKHCEKWESVQNADKIYIKNHSGFHKNPSFFDYSILFAFCLRHGKVPKTRWKHFFAWLWPCLSNEFRVRLHWMCAIMNMKQRFFSLAQRHNELLSTSHKDRIAMIYRIHFHAKSFFFTGGGSVVGEQMHHKIRSVLLFSGRKVLT